jgi:hypothetical protein
VADVALAVRVMSWALVLPILKHIIPVQSLARGMRREAVYAPRDVAREERIVTFARWSARLVRWKSGGNCLERGLIAYRYLCEAGAKPTLVVGLGHGEKGGIIGHAWVLVDGRPAGESQQSVDLYTPVFAFDDSGALLPGIPDSASPQSQPPAFAPSTST